MSLEGSYEYITPGVHDKTTQTLEINQDGTASYREEGKTRMEEWVAQGEGTWELGDKDLVYVTLNELTKEMHFTMQTNVPGIEDGTTVKHNVVIPIPANELRNAPKFGSNRWRVKQ